MKINKQSWRLNPYVLEDILFVVVALALVLGVVIFVHHEYSQHKDKAHVAHYLTLETLPAPAAFHRETV